MAAGKGTLEFGPSQCRYSTPNFPCQLGALWACSVVTGMRAQALPGCLLFTGHGQRVHCVPGVRVVPASCPAPALPACSAAGTDSLYIMLTVEITSRLLFYTAPCQNSPQPSDQDKLNTILAVSIFIPFYKRGRMGGRDPLRCQPSKAPGGCPPSSSQWISTSLPLSSSPPLLDFS